MQYMQHSMHHSWQRSAGVLMVGANLFVKFIAETNQLHVRTAASFKSAQFDFIESDQWQQAFCGHSEYFNFCAFWALRLINIKYNKCIIK